MIHLALFEPRIPQNTGNISRTCVLTGAKLHLIEPMGFTLEESQLKRSGLDYWPYLQLQTHPNVESFFGYIGDAPLFLVTSKARKTYWEEEYPEDVFFFFGREDSGVPVWIREKLSERSIRIPMPGEMNDRSLNLSNAVAVVLYEALRQRMSAL
ncbi:MAG TPA: tRNA (cytidine(34)-2'-O)-methyltransferase [Tissierellia bacterium]|jgi:tRNA (cytidine/uridine-2'-O-)-methyltransferase|nr:tRNA (cytidine(34)-2'-O)-methyltransferase [Tissierellia bacterium]